MFAAWDPYDMTLVRVFAGWFCMVHGTGLAQHPMMVTAGSS